MTSDDERPREADETSSPEAASGPPASDPWAQPQQPWQEPASHDTVSHDTTPLPSYTPEYAPEPSAYEPAYTPDYTPEPPAYAAAPAFPPQYSYAPPEPERDGKRASVPGWLWPVVAATALIVGTIGGAIGGTIVADEGSSDDSFFDSSPSGTSDEELDGLDDLPPQEPLPADNASVVAVAARLLPSTVQIDAGDATGSGFVLDRSGHVITNNHVVADATGAGEVQVVDVRGRRFDATIVGRSPVYDIAVLEVDNPRGLRPAAIGSSRAMRIGETVVAIGSPLGLSSTVTSGIVSAIDRPVTTGQGGGDSSYINAVQTDAAINPGNSGGPLVNLRGEVVGVNSAIATTGGVVAGEAGSIGVGFAIPMEQVRVTAQQILDTGEALYPVIGANVNTLPDERGANIVDVNVDTPAEAAGLEADDLVVALNGRPVLDSIELIVGIRSNQPGDTITLTVLRDGTRRDIEIELGGETDSPD